MSHETSPRGAFAEGLRAALPFVIVVVPFSVLFGVVGTEAGLSLAQVMGFSIVVVAGASQFAALQLMAESAPVMIVVASALAVNLRMAMYSAALAPHLGQAPLWQRMLIAYMNIDQTYVISVQRYESSAPLSLQARVAYFLGSCGPLVLPWYAGTLAGALLGSAVPPEWGIEIVVPLTFLALIAPGLRTLAHWVAALSATALALALAGLPWNLGLLVAGIGGMAAGAEVERRMSQGTPPRRAGQ